MGDSMAFRLVSEHPRRWDVPLLAAAAFGLLALGVRAPALTFENLFADDHFSVLTGIEGFFATGNLLLGLLLLSFSVLFPAAKLIAIEVLWFARIDARDRAAWVHWLELLAKWSFLDAFVIAIVVGTVQLGILTEATAEPGIYLYLAAILLSLVATFLLRPLLQQHDGRSGRLRRAGLWITVPSAVLYGIGLSLPLLHIESGLFWESGFSLLHGTRRMLDEGEIGLAVSLIVFVVAVPSVRFIGLIALRAVRSDSTRLVRVLRTIDKWSMADVFVLAILVVFSKLGALAAVEPKAGMWCLFVAALLSGTDSILLQRARPR